MNSTPHEPSWVGQTAIRHIRISTEMLDQFVALSGDRSPIHVDDVAAKRHGFDRRVVHGMFLGALVSEVVGMELPGELGVIHEIQMAFRNPCYLGDDITIHVAVVEFFESVQTLELQVTIRRSDNVLLATGRVQTGLVSRVD